MYTAALLVVWALSGPAQAESTPPIPFHSEVLEIPDDVWSQMQGVSWKPGCPVGGREDIRLIRVSHYSPDGSIQQGEIIVAARVAPLIREVFGDLYTARFPIQEISRVDKYGGSDNASMRANNTSGLNCRTVAGTQRWSQHSYGLAIDLNPLWNPWVRGSKVDPKQGEPWVDRSKHRPGMTQRGGPAVEAFTSRGWVWGGTWRSTKDYQHFSETGK
jgi:poly-gamma-glutamate synthesis protein (capsule biosynthesis protein)